MAPSLWQGLVSGGQGGREESDGGDCGVPAHVHLHRCARPSRRQYRCVLKGLPEVEPSCSDLRADYVSGSWNVMQSHDYCMVSNVRTYPDSSRIFSSSKALFMLLNQGTFCAFVATEFGALSLWSLHQYTPVSGMNHMAAFPHAEHGRIAEMATDRQVRASAFHRLLRSERSVMRVIGPFASLIS